MAHQKPNETDLLDTETFDTLNDTVRKCIVTGQTYPKNRLIRFCVSPDKVIVPDLAQKLPGRGAWVLGTKESVQIAVTKGLFGKAVKSKVTYPDSMPDLIEDLFLKRCISLLGMARKAGLVVSGFEKLVLALSKNRVRYVLEALDAGNDGREKIARQSKDIPKLCVMTAQQMGFALGRDNCVHAGLVAGGVTETLVAEVERYITYRS